VGKSLPLLTNLERGRFAVIIFENLNKYLNMNKWNRELLDKYCREYSVGIIGMIQPNDEKRNGVQLRGFPLQMDTGVAIRDFRLNPLSPILRVTRAGEVQFGNLPGDDWVVFYSNHTSYQPLGQAYLQRPIELYSNDVNTNETNFIPKKKLVTTVIQV
jgi:heparan sulfate N-deacetylase/N-sulfotransferase NDST2